MVTLERDIYAHSDTIRRPHEYHTHRVFPTLLKQSMSCDRKYRDYGMMECSISNFKIFDDESIWDTMVVVVFLFLLY